MAYISQKGYDELVAKLQHMESVDRPAASAAIAEARDKGDLSENAEYDAAKEWQGKLETEIAMLKKTIMEAKIIDTTHMDTSTVQILSTVELRNVKTKQQMKYTIVSATEADLRAGKLSVETPIAKGLLGKKVGEVAEVKVPAGTVQLEVVSIKFE
ncbi:MAG: transcription elongation factor GreA [Bacteroidaceae bacterium]|jgi:transcription elongation factor GreA|nr:transcription elongation factor GreA [Bacteroidaceae bacterium]MBR6170123.1 transcription elongation factor GreA [Bacteroidaceae bacterium]